ncbi:MAG: beta-phosphoglucomutase [Butyrivibrio sp.]|nr:beta-phosphoglucomutase [Butyrivibrio sp.]
MKYKAIIFDLDGVICFTDEYHYLAWKELADELNIPFDRTINERLRGVSRMDSLEIILEKYSGPEFSKDEKEKFAGKKNDIYRKSLENMSEKDLSEEVRETLKELRNRGLKLAIGSSSKNTKFILKQIGLEGFFDAISDGTNITRSKPDPEVFLKAAQFLAEEPKDCLVIEDAEAGIDAAVSGGFYSAGIGCAESYGKATYHLESFKDILKYVSSYCSDRNAH